MNKKVLSILLTGIMTVSLAFTGCSNSKSKEANNPKKENEQVTIEYWQYFYEPKVKLMDKLIEDFQNKNPNIKVVQKHFPYDAYQQKVTAAVSTGTGPDIINLYYGWLPKFVKANALQQLPEKDFPADMIEKEFAPMVKVNKLDGKYYAVPTAVRTMALFWNKDIFKANGLDPETPPKDLKELVEMAKKCTLRKDGNLEIEGLTFQPTGQLHSWFRPILLTQFGQQPISDDNKKVLWNASENGYKAFEFLVDLVRKEKVGENNFFTDDSTAFINGKAALHIDGSYRLSGIAKQAPNLNYGVAPLPEHNGKQISFGSFWTNGITRNAQGAKLEASVKFLQYLTSAEVMKEWTKETGEIGARVSLVNDPEMLKVPNLEVFIKQLPVAESYFYVDEGADRKALIDAIDQVLLNNQDPKKALDDAVVQVQKILDEYWK
ncbi:extracellular solute-binding protein [Clostridium malenominatum]|uniref:Extracellular solute-binding protein n=1 Tax=Clostridium malenominatum TaxID=1539 RepID=A0ABN1J257_9CLOT